MLKIIEKIFMPILMSFRSKILKPLKTITKLPMTIAIKIRKYLTNIIKKKEITIDDYIKIGRYYIAKKLVIIMLLLSFALVYFLFIKPPAIINKLFNQATVIKADSPKIASFSGKAKIIDENGQVVYEGFLQDGLYTGYGKLYLSEDSVLLYEGEFLNGLRHGFGTSYDEHGIITYKGNFANDAPHGLGETYQNGILFYKGEHQQGQLTGQGEVFNKKGEVIYKGSLINGVYSGSGILYENGKIIYEGEFSNGKFAGKGTKYSAAGKIVYEGEFQNGMYGGQGVAYFYNGNVKYEGQFVNGQYSGSGTAFYNNGNVRYEGNFLANLFHGEGTLYNQKGIVIYTGTFQHNQFHGEGSLFNDDGTLLFEGEFRNNEYYLGTLYSQDGLPLYRGFFTNNDIAPWLFLGITEERLKEILEEPSSEIILDDAFQPTTEVIPVLADGEENNEEKETSLEEYPKKLIYSPYGMAFIVELIDEENQITKVNEIIIFHETLAKTVYENVNKNDAFVKNPLRSETGEQILLMRQDKLLLTFRIKDKDIIQSLIINGSYTPTQDEPSK